MQCLYLPLSFTLIIASPTRVLVQSALGVSDNALRASYCIGVLDEHEKSLLPAGPVDCSGWANFKVFKSEQDCKDQLGAGGGHSQG
jgi:hypothetical protein